MPAYCFFDVVEETDAVKMQEYRNKVFPVVAQYGGKYRVIGGPLEAVEGNWRPAFPVLIEASNKPIGGTTLKSIGSSRNCAWRQRKVMPFSWLALRSNGSGRRRNRRRGTGSHSQTEVPASSCGCGMIVLD